MSPYCLLIDNDREILFNTILFCWILVYRQNLYVVAPLPMVAQYQKRKMTISLNYQRNNSLWNKSDMIIRTIREPSFTKQDCL